MKRLRLFLLLWVGLCPLLALAKGEPSIVLQWPTDKPVLQLTFVRFKLLYTQGSTNQYASEVTVQNLSDKTFPRVDFTVYLIDKNHVRIGDSFLSVTDIGPSQQVKLPFQFTSVGIPASLSLSARKEMLTVPAAKTIALKVISVPPGAKLKVDGTEIGITPVLARLTVGTHALELTKEGYAVGNTSVEIAPDDLPGGSISVELGGLSRDTLELRDGTVLLGDAISLSMTSVLMRIDGKDQTYPRNQVKKIMLVERETVQQPAVVQPAPPPQ